MSASKHFRPLEQAAFKGLHQSPSLKGLLKPFKGKGELEAFSQQCITQRDELIQLARTVVQQASQYPFSLLPIRMTLQTTGSGTAFLRWRNIDRSKMGVQLWANLIADMNTPSYLIKDLQAMELQRITLNYQISMTHNLGRQAADCAAKMTQAERCLAQRSAGGRA